MSSELVVGFRAHIDRHEKSSFGTGSRRKPWTAPEYALVFDTETTADELQRLLYGWYRVLRRTARGTWRVVGEGMVHADDLEARDPNGFAALREYAATHKAEVVMGKSRTIPLHSRETFIRKVFMPYAFHRRALVVGFNLPFDLSRLAVRQRRAGGKQYRGGFTFVLSRYQDEETGEYHDHQFIPCISVKVLDNARAFIGFRRARAPDRDQTADIDSETTDWYFTGHFLDIRTLLFALTDKKYSLDRAAKEFLSVRKDKAPPHGIITARHIEYARQDVRVTQQLFAYALPEFEKLPIALDPCKAYSSATIAKHYLLAMGITPLRLKFSTALAPEHLGWAMASYYGGRAGVYARRQPVPVVMLDFQSMYPTVFTLMRLWQWVIADRLEIEDCTKEAQAFLDRVSLDGCFDKNLWTQLGFFAEVQPQGETYPVRAPYDDDGEHFTTGFNRFTAAYTTVYAGPDLVAATLEDGQAPRLGRAFRIVPVGIQAGLQSIRLPHGVSIDPAQDDFFKAVIEERLKQKAQASSSPIAKRIAHALKILANSGAYGIFAEVLPQDVLRPERVTLYGRSAAFERTTIMPEEPGLFYCPPIASLVTAAARLMLAIGECEVRKRGGVIAMCDTDSLAPVATRRGGRLPEPLEHGPHVRALSWAEVEAIRRRYEALNPYARSALAGSILDLTTENFVYGVQRALVFLGISAKRYALYRRRKRGVSIVTASEHGLGQYVSPDVAPEDEDETRDQAKPWITLVWRRIIHECEGLAPIRLSFANLPALSRFSITSPEQLAPFIARQSSMWAYDDHVKPFNFVLAAHRESDFALPDDPATKRPVNKFQLITSYDVDRSRWLTRPCFDIHTGKAYAVTVDGPPRPGGPIVVKSYGYVVERYALHPESKSMSATGAPCDGLTRGLLVRRHVVATDFRHLGKEANKLERVFFGQEHVYSGVQAIYVDPAHDPFRVLYVPKMRTVKPRRRLARAAGITTRAVRAILQGARPRPHVRSLLMQYLDALAPSPTERPT